MNDCPCLRCLLSRIARREGVRITHLSAVLANGKLVQAGPEKMPPMAEWLLSCIPSFSSWALTPLTSGDLSKAVFTNGGEGFVRQLQICLPKDKVAPIPPLACRKAEERRWIGCRN